MTKAESSRKSPLKVLFLFQGTTHYYNLVLSKLNARSEVDVVDVVPAKPQNLGEGVYQTRRGISFTIYGLPEYKILNRYFFFRGLWKLLLKERPQIIVTTKVYLRGFYYHLPTLFVRYILGIKLILKDHTFRFLPFRTRQQNLLDEFRRRPDRSPLAFLQNALPLLFHQIALYEERTLYRSLNAIVCYIDNAYTLFGSFGVPTEPIPNHPCGTTRPMEKRRSSHPRFRAGKAAVFECRTFDCGLRTRKEGVGAADSLTRTGSVGEGFRRYIRG